MSDSAARGDYFDRARRIAVVVLVLAGVGAVAGSLMNWVTITEAPELVKGSDFGDERPEPPNTTPFTGIEATDGWVVLGAGLVVVAAAGLLLARRRAGWGWLALLASVVIGAVAFADYRGITTLAREMDRSGDIDPGIGLTLVAAAAITGLVASVAAVAATPAERSYG